MTTPAEARIAGLDHHIHVAGLRLRDYEATGDERSSAVQRGVIDRLLDERLATRRPAGAREEE